MIGLGRAAAGEQEQVEPFHVETPADDSRNDWITHSFYLRPDVTLEIELPPDLTTREAIRIARFVRALPFDGE